MVNNLSIRSLLQPRVKANEVSLQTVEFLEKAFRNHTTTHPEKVLEFVTMYSQGYRYSYEAHLDVEYQLGLPKGITPLSPCKDRNFFLTEHDLLSDSANSDASTLKSSEGQLLLHRMRRAGYFRKIAYRPDGSVDNDAPVTTLYKLGLDNTLAECTLAEVSDIASSLIKLGHMESRRGDKHNPGKAVDICKEYHPNSIDGYDDFKFTRASTLRDASSRASIVFPIAKGLPGISKVHGVSVLFNKDFTGLCTIQEGYDPVTGEFHPSSYGLQAKIDALKDKTEEELRKNFQEHWQKLFGTLPIFTQDSGQMDALLLMFMCGLARSRFQPVPLFLFTTGELAAQGTGKTHPAEKLHALLGGGPYGLATKLGSSEFNISHFDRVVGSLMCEELNQIILLDNILPAEEKVRDADGKDYKAILPLALSSDFSAYLTTKKRTVAIQRTSLGTKYGVSTQRMFVATGNALTCGDELRRRTIFFKLDLATQRKINFSTSDGLQEDDVELRTDILASILALYARFWESDACKDVDALGVTPRYRSYGAALKAFAPFCIWATGMNSLREGQAYNVDPTTTPSVGELVAVTKTPAAIARAGFTREWTKLFGETQISAADIFALVKTLPTVKFGGLFSKEQARTAVTLGKRLRAFVDEGWLLQKRSASGTLYFLASTKTPYQHDIRNYLSDDYPQNETSIACPFHDDQTPSLQVNAPTKEHARYTYFCHAGCGTFSTVDVAAKLWNIDADGAIARLQDEVVAKLEFVPKAKATLSAEGLEAIFAQLQPTTNHPYLTKKRMWDLKDVFVSSLTIQEGESVIYPGSLAIPYYALGTDVLQTMQIIPGSDLTKKLWLKGTTSKNAEHVIREDANFETVYICEGVATAWAFARLLRSGYFAKLAPHQAVKVISVGAKHSLVSAQEHYAALQKEAVIVSDFDKGQAASPFTDSIWAGDFECSLDGSYDFWDIWNEQNPEGDDDEDDEEEEDEEEVVEVEEEVVEVEDEDVDVDVDEDYFAQKDDLANKTQKDAISAAKSKNSKPKSVKPKAAVRTLFTGTESLPIEASYQVLITDAKLKSSLAEKGQPESTRKKFIAVTYHIQTGRFAGRSVPEKFFVINYKENRYTAGHRDGFNKLCEVLDIAPCFLDDTSQVDDAHIEHILKKQVIGKTLGILVSSYRNDPAFGESVEVVQYSSWTPAEKPQNNAVRFEKISFFASLQSLVTKIGDDLVGFDCETSNYKKSTLEDTKARKEEQKELNMTPELGAKAFLAQIYYPKEDVVYVVQPEYLDVPAVQVIEEISKLRGVAHNAEFERLFFPKMHLECSMLAAFSSGLFSGGDSGDTALLGFCDLGNVSKKLNVGISYTDKAQMQKSDWATPKLTDQQLNYAAKDAIAAFKVWEVLNQTRSFDDVQYKINQDLQPVLRRVEAQGLPVNLDKVQARLAKLEAERLALEQQLRASPFAHGLSELGTFTCTAGKRVFSKNIINKDTWPKSQKDTGFCMGKKEVVAYRSNLQPEFAEFYIDRYIPFAENLKASRELQKVMSSKTLGRYFGRFLTHGTATGRLSCKDNNLQNVDRSMRDIFEVPENSEYCFITADYSQVELRIQGALSQDEAILDVYRAGRDLHAETAATFLGMSVEQFAALKETDPTLFAESRTKAKAVNFGAAFGMSAKGLVDVAATQYKTTLTHEQAQAFFDLHKQKYPTFYAWGAAQAERAKRDGYILTPGGRKRFVDKNAKNLARLAVNTPIQGGCAAALKLAMLKLGKDFPLVNSVHDELVVFGCKDEKEKLQAQLRVAMTEALTEVFPNIPFDVEGSLVDIKAGSSWQK